MSYLVEVQTVFTPTLVFVFACNSSQHSFTPDKFVLFVLCVVFLFEQVITPAWAPRMSKIKSLIHMFMLISVCKS